VVVERFWIVRLSIQDPYRQGIINQRRRAGQFVFSTQGINRFTNFEEEKTMKAGTVFGTLAMLLALVQVGIAGGKEDIQKYFNDTASKVKATGNPVQKREILNKSLQNMSQALNRVEGSGLISREDRAGISRLKANIQEKQDELTGSNGYVRVDDAQLNAFSDYVVQDMEQAETITISLVSALLIIIILILIL
jgi:hypothetical protein